MNLFERERVELMLNYAKSFIGTPYVWGANGGGAFDCSGYVQEVLSCIGLDPKGDQTAQKLYDFFIKKVEARAFKKAAYCFGEKMLKVFHMSVLLLIFIIILNLVVVILERKPLPMPLLKMQWLEYGQFLNDLI